MTNIAWRRWRPWLRRALAGAAAILVGFGLGGCAPMLVGAGAVGGFALLGRDSVSKALDVPKGRVFRESVAVMETHGLITMMDEPRGIITAKVDDATVTITVAALTPHTVQLKVRARSSYQMPAMDAAHAVYNAILDRLYS